MRCEFGGTPNCKVHKWVDELQLLRKIVLQCGLDEDCKWGVPCYTYDSKNILLVSAFKDYCCISFFKGSLLVDNKKILVKPGPNSQAARLFKFNSIQEIRKIQSDIKTYILEAVELERAGRQVDFNKNIEPIPTVLKSRFESDPVLQGAFESLTPGRQRGYLIHFKQPKQSKTRISRIEKCIPLILSGTGLHDKYNTSKNKTHDNNR